MKGNCGIVLPLWVCPPYGQHATVCATPRSPIGVLMRTHGMVDIPIIEQEGLKLATDSLCYFAHWITPEASPIRFDARFFVASAPPDQEACSDGLETTVAKWISPQELLEEHRKGALFLPVPTLSSVSTLARFSSVDEVIASTRGKAIHAGHG